MQRSTCSSTGRPVRPPGARRQGVCLLAGFLLLLALGAAFRPADAQAQADDRYLFLQFPQKQVRPQARPEPRRRAPAPANASTVVVSDRPGGVAAEPSAYVFVLGDTLAESLATGLAEAFSDNPEVQVLRRTSVASGLVRSDFLDWRAVVRDVLGGGAKITHAVMLAGSNDRQGFRDAGADAQEPFSQAWRNAYAARLDEIMKAFADKAIPLYWVGLPIMENGRMASDMAILNEIAREAARRNNATFIDLWEPFGDAQNRYSATGPDLNGDTVRLRTSDGVNFTRLGARKAAHFVELEIRRALEGRAPAVIAMPDDDADPASQDPALRPGGIERAIDEAVRRGLDGLPPVPIAIPQKPPAGPILPLTVPDATAGGQLVASPAALRPTGDAGLLIERVIVQGRPPEPKAGRADDFRWPGSAR